MAGTSEQALTKIGPWPAGVNNKDNEEALPTPEDSFIPLALREAVNVDIDTKGWPSRREGYSLRVAATKAHSMFAPADVLYAIVDGDLKAYNQNLGVIGTIRAGVGDRYASYAQTQEDIYWSNGVEIRRIDPDLNDLPAALPTPAVPFVASSVSGGLAAGEYFVCLTWLSAQGRESGASPATSVIVPANGGIMITGMPAAAEHAAKVRVYVSPPDGEVLYSAFELPAGSTTIHVGAHTPGKACETQWLVPMPPCDILRFWNGRLLGASSNMFSWAETLRGALMDQDSMMRFGLHINMMEPVGEGGDGGGVFIADHKRTYFLSGDVPDKWQRVIRYPHSVVPGTSLTVEGTVFGLDSTAPVAFWLASNGQFCIGLPGGKIQPINETSLALPTGERGTAAFREHAGLRQIITSYHAGEISTAGISDSISATVRRNGVTIT